jgi:hypothetical protein
MFQERVIRLIFLSQREMELKSMSAVLLFGIQSVMILLRPIEFLQILLWTNVSAWFHIHLVFVSFEKLQRNCSVYVSHLLVAGTHFSTKWL